MDYVHALRVDMAKELLEKDNHVVDMVSFEVGYEDPASFRRIFKRRVEMTPGDVLCDIVRVLYYPPREDIAFKAPRAGQENRRWNRPIF